MKKTKSNSYHHGDLKKTLIEAGVTILGEEGIKNLSLREAARRAARRQQGGGGPRDFACRQQRDWSQP